MSSGIYLFCLIPAESSAKIEGRGIDGECLLFMETIGDVTAIFSEVSLEDFSGPESRNNFENLAWVAPRALRHEEVVLAAMELGQVLPVRFGTVFSSLEATEPLRQRQDIFNVFFRDTAGKREWTLKGYADRPQVRAQMTETRLVEQKEHLAELSPGKRYFFEQKIKEAVNRDVTSWLKETAHDIRRLALEVSDGFSDCRLQSREVTGRDEEMFFHGALLVPDQAAMIVQRKTHEWNERRKARGLRMELSGPWPPYHFSPVL